MSLKSNIWKFYLVSALGMHFITPIRILYLLSFGMSYAQIAMMELAASIAIILLEIPSGILADLLGRKLSRLISYGLSISAFTCLSFGSTPAVFIFGWALSGAADAFQSGAGDALVYDTLKQLGREGEYLKIKSHFLLITTISVIFGSIIGARLYLIDHRLPWYLVTISIVMSALVFITIK
jgi:MFS family permease